jgi:tyrosyl-tRNA synthetase
MSAPRSDLIHTLTSRGFLAQCTDMEALDAKARTSTITAYIGFDATADSLHVGSLMPIMMLHWLQATGHRPIALMGGGTTKVGDPSGKDEGRQLLSDEQINGNIAEIRKCFAQYLNFEGPAPASAALMANNADWLDALAYIPFLRDVGRHFTINRMLTFDSVKLRLDREQPLTFLEFNYMILQAYDFLELNRRFDCTLQLGGSDQWGNIVNGIELGRRVAGAELYGFTCPLIQTASGQKMGKTAAGAVWLNPDRRSPYDFWQFWRNTEDGDVGRFLRLFTTLPLDEIARLEALQGAEINEAKKILANAATAMLHGAAAAHEAEATAKRVFDEGATGSALPVAAISTEEQSTGISVIDGMRRLGLAASNGEARRLIAGGGTYLNGKAIADPDHVIRADDFNAQGEAKLSVGKKRHGILRAG